MSWAWGELEKCWNLQRNFDLILLFPNQMHIQFRILKLQLLTTFVKGYDAWQGAKYASANAHTTNAFWSLDLVPITLHCLRNRKPLTVTHTFVTAFRFYVNKFGFSFPFRRDTCDIPGTNYLISDNLASNINSFMTEVPIIKKQSTNLHCKSMGWFLYG